MGILFSRADELQLRFLSEYLFCYCFNLALEACINDASGSQTKMALANI